MLTIIANNVNDAYAEALWLMSMQGVESDSRNGRVKRMPCPVVTVYKHPMERMLFDAQRDANPFFHIFESIWMLAGRCDVAFPSQFAKQIAQYSDDGYSLNGAYGHRWRNHWDNDQLIWVIEHLKKNPTSRRAVIQMYDPHADQEIEPWTTKDVPCNTAIYFSVQSGYLDMTVTNRSNDIVWGCYGANAVHMSMLQQFVAEAVNIPVGKYYQFSNDWHIYEQHFPLLGNIPPRELDMYPSGYSLLIDNSPSQALDCFEAWCDDPGSKPPSTYVNDVLTPMYQSWLWYKEGDKRGAFNWCTCILDVPVRLACIWWLMRRKWS